jgi:hypothetical protein
MGDDGETPNFKDSSCAALKSGGFAELFDSVCARQTNWGPWLAVRGRCVRYRQLDQSCNAYFAGSGGITPHYAVDSQRGHPPTRPLLCAPGLVCTGDVEPVPHTCVKARPPDVCYQAGAAALCCPCLLGLLLLLGCCCRAAAEDAPLLRTCSRLLCWLDRML